MQDIINDIQILENAIIAFTEGASDEKRSALYSLEKLMTEKKQSFEDFENRYAPEEV
ncbi:hypothetical protein N9R43_00920 [bacterium]|nr:hypothetical protein [bacterium]